MLLLNILQCTGQPLTTKNYPAPNANSAEVEKHWIQFRAGAELPDNTSDINSSTMSEAKAC